MDFSNELDFNEIVYSNEKKVNEAIRKSNRKQIEDVIIFLEEEVDKRLNSGLDTERGIYDEDIGYASYMIKNLKKLKFD